MALSFYTSSLKKFLDGDIDLLVDTINILVLQTGYTFSAAHDFRDDLTTLEVDGTNYTQGGIALAGKTTSAVNPSVFTANDIVIAQSGTGFNDGQEYAFCKIVGSAATDPLIAHGVNGAAFGNIAGQLTLDIPTSLFALAG